MLMRNSHAYLARCTAAAAADAAADVAAKEH